MQALISSWLVLCSAPTQFLSDLAATPCFKISLSALEINLAMCLYMNPTRCNYHKHCLKSFRHYK